MRATNSPRRGHLGFTLIELLVVISIIGILMGLLLGGVQKVREVGKRTTVVDEINKLDVVVSTFKTTFGFAPPQYIRLPGVVPDSTWATYAAGSPQKESFDGFQQLLQMFPRWQISGAAASSAAPGTPTGLKFCSTFANPSVVSADANGLPLEGSQSLVFFLGGPELQGFTPSGPYSPLPTATSKKGPYFDFVVNRLNPSADVKFRNGYLDPYGTPYAYFSTFSGTNYNLAYAWAPPAPVAPSPAYANPMRAYQDPSGKWINPGRVQIISAGKNKRFGPGTVVVPGPPVTYVFWVPMGTGYMMDSAPPNGDGGDDLANFNGGAQLGASGN